MPPPGAWPTGKDVADFPRRLYLRQSPGWKSSSTV